MSKQPCQNFIYIIIYINVKNVKLLPCDKLLAVVFFFLITNCTQCVSVWYCDFLDITSGSVSLSSALQVSCQGYLTLSSWPLRPALGAQGGIVFQGSDPIAKAYNGSCSLMIPSMDTWGIFQVQQRHLPPQPVLVGLGTLPVWSMTAYSSSRLAYFAANPQYVGVFPLSATCGHAWLGGSPHH